MIVAFLGHTYLCFNVKNLKAVKNIMAPIIKNKTGPQRTRHRLHTGQCKRTGGCYNELVVAFFSTGGGVKGKRNLYLLTLLFVYKLAFILFVMTPGAQTTGNIAVYGSAKHLVI